MADDEKPTEEKPKELTFPKTFDKCPHCGSTRRFAEVGLKGEMPEGLENFQPILFSQKRTYPGRLFPVHLQALFDVCLDCGSPYAVVLDKSKGVPRLGGDGPRPRLQRPR